MKSTLKRNLVFPILFLMIMPTIILSFLFFNSMQKDSYESAIQNVDNSLNFISVALSQTDDLSSSKQFLFNYLAFLNNYTVIVYEGEKIIYQNMNSSNLTLESLNIHYKEDNRYEVKNRVYEDLNISVYVIIDKVEIFQNILSLNKFYLIFIFISIIISSKAILFITENFSKPIDILLKGYNDILSGNLQNDISIKREDELGFLGEAFNEMKNQISIRTHKFLQMKRFNEDILKSISTGIITTDMDGKVNNYNHAASDIIEKVMCFNPDNVEIIKVLLSQINETIQVMEPINKVASFHTSNAKMPIYLDITTALMKNSFEECIGVICSFNDISNRKQIEDNIERINRLASLGELTAGLAHEVRNPLSGIKMSTQILRKRLFPHLSLSDNHLFEAMIKEIERLDLLITDLLNFAKPNIPKFQIVDVADILEKALLFSEKKIQEKQIIVRVHYEVDNMYAYFDKGQLSQIFLNIISNALDAMKDHKTLKITITSSSLKKNDFILVIFEDNGCGIDKGNLDRIFNPFFTTKETGTGLGLSVVYKLITSNNADIKIESVEKGGTTVKIYLPKCRSDINDYENSCN